MSKRTKWLLAIGAIAALIFGMQVAAFAALDNAALTGSKFEIDNNANLKHDGDASQATTDWADLAHSNGPEIRATDLPTGANDDSYKGGVKETTVCPGETTGSTWGPRQNLAQGTTCDGGPCAVGTINNTSALAAADTDGLGNKALRTFGEAQIDLDIIQSSDGCTTFGSGMAKSRSSDADRSQLKDFIAPIGIDVGTCGTVKVVKDDAANNATKLAGAEFDLLENNAPTAAPPGNEDTVVDSCTTAANGECEFGSVQEGAYWVVETKAPTGYDLPTPPYQAVTVTADETVTVTFHDPAQKGGDPDHQAAQARS